MKKMLGISIKMDRLIKGEKKEGKHTAYSKKGF